MVTVEFDCLFGREGSAHVVSAGTVRMDFRRVDGTHNYVLDAVRTDAASVAAFFRGDARQVQEVLSDIEKNLDHQETASWSRGLNY